MITQRLPRFLLAFVASVALTMGLVLAVSVAPAGAQSAEAIELVDSTGIEAALLALTPIATLISGFLLRPSAADAVKKAAPAVIAVIMSVIYFMADAFPETTSGLIANLLVVVVMAQKLYDPLDGFSELILKRRLNTVTPGVIGTPVITEGD